MTLRLDGHRMWKIAVPVPAGLVLILGIAYASVPDANGLVHTCYKSGDAAKAGGASLSVIDSDNGGTGKAGDTGLALAQGGPYWYHRFMDYSSLSSYGSDLVTLALPPGNYLVTAKLIAADASTGALFQCALTLNGNLLDYSAGYSPGDHT